MKCLLIISILIDVVAFSLLAVSNYNVIKLLDCLFTINWLITNHL